MLDSGTKPPENRIHLFDPVGLINEGYGGTYRSSNYAVKPRRPTKSYGNFEEVATNGGLKSYDSFNTDENGVGALRSYDSYTDPNNPGLRSYDSFSMETNNNGGNNNNTTRSYDHNNIDNNDVNGLELRFGVHDNNNGELDDEDNDVSTPRMWKPTSPPTSPKSLNSSSYFQNNNSFNSTNSTNSPKSPSFHPRNSKSLNSSPLHPSSVNPNNNNTTNSNSSVISVNSMSLNPSSPKHNYPQNMSPSSRTQAIAKGRRELMDMVRDLPESFYELSLKDIVDKKTEFGVQKGVGVGLDIPEEKKGVKENGNKPLETAMVKKKAKKVKKSESKKKMVRGKNVDNKGRFLLRTSVFPIFSRSKKNKKRLVNGSSFKVAPMSKPNPSSNGSMKVVEKDWWGRKSTMESDDGNASSNKSESSVSSSSRSSSSNGRYFLKCLRCFIHMNN
ncbi:hypothetical protein KSS87_004588 [Heliosperma pusillum]|nr:hypothetical protein KSS87_004588 [Heliosperma pusillum]